jgi:hypothetical protein
MTNQEPKNARYRVKGAHPDTAARNAAHRGSAYKNGRCRLPVLRQIPPEILVATEKKHMRLVPVIALLLAAGCRTTQPVHVAQPATGMESIVSHPFSRMEFPDTVGHFRRGEINRYDQEGRDMSVAYNLVRLGSAVAGTVYVYPAPVDVAVFPIPKVGEAPEWFVKNHAEAIKTEIIRYHEGAAILSEDDIEIKQPSGLQKGRRILFQYTEDTPYGPQPFLSEMLLFTHGKWFIKYRFTYLRDYKVVVKKDIDEFLESLKWHQ